MLGTWLQASHLLPLAHGSLGVLHLRTEAQVPGFADPARCPRVANVLGISGIREQEVVVGITTRSGDLARQARKWQLH